MVARSHFLFGTALAFAILSLLLAPSVSGHEDHLHNAPPAAAEMTNPYADNPRAAAAGKKLYGQNCSQCHGNNRQGMGPAPALDTDEVRQAKPGALFWFITNGDLNRGMPSWSSLPKQQRWQVVTFLQTDTSNP